MGRIPFYETCRIPRDLQTVTTRARDEVDPRSVNVDPAAAEAIWHAVKRLYRSGMHPAIQLCVRRHGEILLHRSIGHARGNGPGEPAGASKILATPETPFNIFSASKAVTAMVIHLLDQQHLLHVNDPVSEYIPEFSRHGKDRITIEHVLTHRAGIPNLPPEEINLENLLQPDKIVELLCDAEPTWTPGRRLAYHAITGGFVLGEIVRRVTGKTIREVLRESILAPLGFRWMNYGVKPSDIERVAVNAFTGAPPLFPFSYLIRRALGLDFREAVELSNDPRFLTQVIPAANVVTTANELSRFYQLLLDGGELDGVRIYEPRTVRRATSEQSYLEFDFTLGIPTRYSMGFMLGGMVVYGPDTHLAYGHIGLLNIIGWADPERQVSAAILNSGKPLLYPEIIHLYDVMRQISRACSKEPPRQLRRPPRRVASRGRRSGKRPAEASSPQAAQG